MINKTILVGRITKDPEIKYTNSNIPVAKFTLAVNRTFAGPTGEREADFIQCVTWRKQAENLSRFVRKGSLIGVEGRIQTGSYEDKDGIRKYTTEVICDSVQFLEPKNSEQPTNAYEVANREYEKNNQPSIDVTEKMLPF